MTPPVDAIPPKRFPRRLADLGYSARVLAGTEVILPPLCEVPAGEFLMGSDPMQDQDALDDERPQHAVALPAYRIGRFPVTVAEYACFVRAGHARPPLVHYSGQANATTDRWEWVNWRTQLRRLDHPVVCVSWHDAAAYAAWLAGVTGGPWRLPTEAEWEKSARWDPANRHARLYPWGQTFDKDRCNTRESGIGTTTPVGTYPTGASPCGAHDMVGNVYEWTSSLFQPYPYRRGEGQEGLEAPEAPVERGGSFRIATRYARAACRGATGPDDFSYVLGFRVACAGPDSVEPG
jgi:formylglycine-generating enzyme required for sulfatase activity